MRQVIDSLIIAAGVVLVGSIVGTVEAVSGPIYPVSQYAKSLGQIASREELLEVLNEFNYSDSYNSVLRKSTKGEIRVHHETTAVEFVLETLHRADEKMDVINGLTVAELIAQNHFDSEAQCNKMPLGERASMLSKAESIYGIHFYLAILLYDVAIRCYYLHFGWVSSEIDQRWLKEVKENSQPEHHHDFVKQYDVVKHKLAPFLLQPKIDPVSGDSMGSSSGTNES